MIHRESFQKDYDYFWSLSPGDRPSTDGDLIALTFVMLAMGTQFVALPSPDEKEQTAEFYRKCPHHKECQAILTLQSLGSTSGSKGFLLSWPSIISFHPGNGSHRLLPDER